MRRIVPILFSFVISFVLFAMDSEAATRRVLVLPITANADSSDAKLAADATTLTSTALEKHGVKIVRSSISKKKTLSPAEAVKNAKYVGAAYAVYGTLNKIGEPFELSYSLVDAGTGNVKPFKLNGENVLQLPSVVNHLVSQMLTEMDLTSSSTQNGKPTKIPAGAISNVTVRGNRFIDSDRILMRVSSKQGDSVDEEKIDNDIKSIWELGFFNDVRADIEPQGSSKNLIFTVVEKPRIDDIRVEGSDEVSIKDIKEAMATHTGSVLNEKILADDIQKVTELYRKKGYYLVEVTHRVQRAQEFSAILLLNIKEGKKMYIKEIVIEGVKQIDPDDIKKYLSLKEKGMFSWFTNSGILKEEFLEKDLQQIRAYLMTYGYLDGVAEEPKVAYDDDGIRIVFKITEGVRYKVGEVKLEGDLIDTEERIYKEIGMDERHAAGDFYNIETLQKDIKALKDFYGDYGFAFAEVNFDHKKNPDTALVDVHYILIPGQKQYIRRVELEGNTRTRDNVILREMRLADGEQFSGAKMRRSAQRLEKMRYFSEVNPKLVPTGKPGEVDLKMGVKETETGMISLGFGYSTYDKFGVTGTITETNLFGRGYKLGLSAYTSSKEQYVQANFINPRLFDTYWGFSVNPYITKAEWSSFSKDSTGIKFGLSHPLGEYTHINFGYQFEHYNVYDVSSSASYVIRESKGKHWASTIYANITRDTTNKPIFPTEGTKISIGASYGGEWMGGDDNFVKPYVSAAFFYGLNDNHILHVRGTAGGAFKVVSDREVPVFQRYWIGGINSIRGYSMDDISPRDPTTNETIGSDRMGYANFEYIWVVKPEAGFALVPFFDIGFNADSDQTDNPFDKWYSSAGLEIRWRSPMGDLRFAYGIPFQKNTEGKKKNGRFEFSMGSAF